MTTPLKKFVLLVGFASFFSLNAYASAGSSKNILEQQQLSKAIRSIAQSVEASDLSQLAEDVNNQSSTQSNSSETAVDGEALAASTNTCIDNLSCSTTGTSSSAMSPIERSSNTNPRLKNRAIDSSTKAE